ncbi:DUF1722 domain-containing protein [Leucothrix sargassi]|nr:DUF1722 domain-containing protein [Leucothrix sargassi]
MQNKIKVGISSCLLGEKVRFDTGHKRNAYVTDVLQNYFDFVPFCPEVSIGLSIPREPIRLVLEDEKVRCVGTKNSELEFTDQLAEIAEKQKPIHEQLCGYILKKDSPSCGMERVKLYKNGMPTKVGVGIFAQRLMENFPSLPVEEEGRLGDMRLRENFIQRVFVYARWKALFHEPLTITALQTFHAQHKYILMSHDQEQTRALGKLLASHDHQAVEVLAERYVSQLMNTLKTIATPKTHANTLHHIQGYLKRDLVADDKAELTEVIDNYRNGLLPLVVPITLLKHHFRKHPNEHITNSYYMDPHPGELMLLNHI